MICRIETTAAGNRFCVFYCSGAIKTYTEKTLPTTAYQFMKNAVKNDRCGKYYNDETGKIMLVCY